VKVGKEPVAEVDEKVLKRARHDPMIYISLKLTLEIRLMKINLFVLWLNYSIIPMGYMNLIKYLIRESQNSFLRISEKCYNKL
jgi:hypothetical protein